MYSLAPDILVHKLTNEPVCYIDDCDVECSDITKDLYPEFWDSDSNLVTL